MSVIGSGGTDAGTVGLPSSSFLVLVSSVAEKGAVYAVLFMSTKYTFTKKDECPG